MQHPNPLVPEMQMAVRARELSDVTRADRQARLLQREVGAVRRSAELPAGRRRRGQHALRAHRDDVLVPHPDPGLPVGAPADRHHPGRRVRRPGQRARGSGWPCRDSDPAALAAALESMLYDDEAIAVATDERRPGAAGLHLGQGAGPAGRVLPRPAAGAGPGAGRRIRPAAGQSVPGAAGAGPAGHRGRRSSYLRRRRRRRHGRRGNRRGCSATRAARKRKAARG